MKGDRMAKIIAIMMLLMPVLLMGSIVITLQEDGEKTQEVYHPGFYGEVANNKLISYWDLNKKLLTIINYQQKAYTQVTAEELSKILNEKQEKQLKEEESKMDSTKIKLMAEATNRRFVNMRVHTLRADTLIIAGEKSIGCEIICDKVLAQKLWVSISLKEKIRAVVPDSLLEPVEGIFKDLRARSLKHMGVLLDPITLASERLGSVGYVMKRYDYGMNKALTEEQKRKIEETAGCVIKVDELQLKEKFFSVPKKFSYYPYELFQIKTNYQF